MSTPTDIPEAPAAIARRAADPFYTQLGQMQASIASILPKHITKERMLRLVYEEGRRVPALRECEPASIALAIIGASQLGLEIGGPTGYAYMIPYSGRATLIIGYKGWCQLALRSPRIRRLHASVVYLDEVEAGTFDVDHGSGVVRHKFTFPAKGIKRDKAEIVGAYCLVELDSGGVECRVLTLDEIEDRRKRGASGKGVKTPWDTDYAAMARKSAIRALLTGGTVPISVDLATALEVDEREPIEVEARQIEPAPRAIAQTSGLDALAERVAAERQPEPAPVTTEATPRRSRPPIDPAPADLVQAVVEGERLVGPDRARRARETQDVPLTLAPAKMSAEQARRLASHLSVVADQLAARQAGEE